MKRIISILVLTSMMIACKSKQTPATVTTNASTPDTAGLSQFQQWKAQHELSTPVQYQSPNQPQKTVVIYKDAPKVSRHRQATQSPVYSSTSESGNTAKASRKKGWSKGAKGAVIGGVGGAVVGAVVDKKNRGAGAVIGGVLGAGAGYGIGHSKDKKSGRNQ